MINGNDRLKIWLESNNATSIGKYKEGGDYYYMVVVPVTNTRKGIHYIFGKLYDVPITGFFFWQYGISYFTNKEDAINAAYKFISKSKICTL